MTLPSHLPPLDATPMMLGRATLPVGATREHARSLRMTARLYGRGLLATKPLDMDAFTQALWREEVLAIDALGHPIAIEVAYLRALANEPLEPGSTLFPEPIQGHRFRASVATPPADATTATAPSSPLADLPIHVSTASGAPAPDEFSRRVASDHRGLGRPPLFATFCPAGAISPNTVMPVTTEVARSWFGFDRTFEVLEASATYVGMASIANASPQSEAVFQIAVTVRGRLGAGDPKEPASFVGTVEARLTGWVGVDPMTGERVSAQLSGPLEISLEGRALGLSHALSGHGRLDLQTRVRLVSPSPASPQ
jgi:hypothetical protein